MKRRYELWGALLIATCMSGGVACGEQSHVVVEEGCEKVLATYSQHVDEGTFFSMVHASEHNKLMKCMKKIIDSLQSQLSAADQKLITSVAQLDDVKQEVADLTKKSGHCYTQLIDANNQVTALTAQSDLCHTQLSDANHQVMGLTKQSEACQVKLTALDQNLTDHIQHENALLSALGGHMGIPNLVLTSAVNASARYFGELAEAVATAKLNVNKNTPLIESLLATLEGYQKDKAKD